MACMALLLLLDGALNVMYSFWLKHIVIVDVFAIAIMFVRRVLAGGAAVHVELSSWLLITTFLLALFLALAKRRHELFFLEESTHSQRPVLYEYSAKLADEMMSLISPVILYDIYPLYPLRGNDRPLPFENPLYNGPSSVVFGIMRYLYLIQLIRILVMIPATLSFMISRYWLPFLAGY